MDRTQTLSAAPRAPALARAFPPWLVNAAEFGFWTLFLFAVSGGFAFALGPGTAERVMWLAADALALAFLGLSLDHYARRIAANGALFAWAALAMLSALWSLAPVLSVYHGAQLFLTLLVGLVIRERFGVEGLARMLFFALLAALALSLPLGAAGRGINAYGEWRGVFSHKNVLGAAMTTLFFLSLARLLSGRDRATALAGIGGAPLALALSGSAAAMVVFAALLAATPFLIAWRAGWGARLAALGLALAAAAGALLAAAALGLDPVETALGALGKDRTLTGRTLLWRFAAEAAAERPLLGYGYKAWWESGATGATYLRYAIGQDLWFFHNNFLEVQVALGAVGMLAFAIGLVAAATEALRRFARRPTPAHGWALLLLLNVLILAMVENPLFVNHGLWQLLFAAAFARMPAPRSPSAG